MIRALNRFGHLAEIGRDQLHLAGCPCILVAPERPCILCDLVMGVVDGVLEASGSNLRVGERRHVLADSRCDVVLTKRSDSRSSPKARYLSAAAAQETREA